MRKRLRKDFYQNLFIGQKSPDFFMCKYTFVLPKIDDADKIFQRILKLDFYCVESVVCCVVVGFTHVLSHFGGK